MTKQTFNKYSRWLPFVAAALVLALSGCVTQPYGGNGGSRGSDYGTTYQDRGRVQQRRTCDNCGVVRDVQRVYIDSRDNSHVLGTIIGAVVGGALGNQVGKGDGRKAATVVGAVAGGVAGNQIAKHNENGNDVGYRISVRLDDGRGATVTQREDPRVRVGDYVLVSNNRVYLQ